MNTTNIKRSTESPVWRFVHDGEKVITAPFQTTGMTASKHSIVEFPTEAECDAEITRLELKPAGFIEE